MQASRPVVQITFYFLFYVVLSFESNRKLNLQIWKYRGTDGMRITALEHLRVDVQTSAGKTETDVLLTGSTNGSMRYNSCLCVRMFSVCRCDCLLSII